MLLRLVVAIDRNKVLEAAQKYLAKGSYDKAIAEYQKLYAADPSDVRTLLKIGDLYTRKGATKEAIEAYMGVAAAYAQTGFSQKAVAVYRQVIKLEPSYVEPYIRLASNFESLGLVSEALGTYEALATLHGSKGETDKALEVLARMVDIDGANLPVRIRYAEGLSKAGKTAEAAREFETGASQLKQQGRIDDYLKVAERLLYHRPDDATLALELSRLYLERDDAKRALAKLQISFKADPKDTVVLELLAQAFIKLDQKPKAVSVYRETAKIHQERKNAEARALVLKRILELDPGDAEARQQLASYAQPHRPELSQDLVMPPAAVVGGGGREPSRAAPMPSTTSRPAPVIPQPGARPQTVAPQPPASSPSEPEEELIIEAESTEISLDLEEPARDQPSIPPDVALEAQVARLLTECDVFARYGLKSKILEQLRRAVALAPKHVEARERLKDALVEAGRTEEAVEQLLALADIFDEERPQLALIYRKQVLTLEPSNERARAAIPPSIRPPAPSTLPPMAEEEAVLYVDDEPELVAEPSGELEEPELLDVEASDEGAVLFLDDASEPPPAATSAALELDDEPELVAEPEPAIEPTQITEMPAAFFEEAILGAQPEEPPFEPEDEPEGLAPMTAQEFEAAPVGEAAPAPLAPAPAGEVEEILDEAEFYLAQGLLEEAYATIEDALEQHPGHPILTDKLEEIGDARAEAAARASLATSEKEDEDESFALAARLAEELDTEAPATQAADAIDVDSVFAQFKKGIEQQIEPSDTDTHYDLGIAYKEMGLYDDAIQAFTLAMQHPSRECTAATMIGLCKMEQGKIDAAIEQFERGLDATGRTPREEMGLYFELAAAYEAKGDLESALESYERVRTYDPTFREVASRIRALEDALAQAPAEEPRDDVDRAFDDLLSDD